MQVRKERQAIWGFSAHATCTANQLDILASSRQYLESERASARGHKLHTVTVLPGAASGPPVAVLVWHHGVAEHVGRWREGEPAGCTCTWLTARAAALRQHFRQRIPDPSSLAPARSVHTSG